MFWYFCVLEFRCMLLIYSGEWKKRNKKKEMVTGYTWIGGWNRSCWFYCRLVHARHQVTISKPLSCFLISMRTSGYRRYFCQYFLVFFSSIFFLLCAVFVIFFLGCVCLVASYLFYRPFVVPATFSISHWKNESIFLNSFKLCVVLWFLFAANFFVPVSIQWYRERNFIYRKFYSRIDHPTMI